MLVWKDIENYEGMYQISSYGVVRSLDRVVTRNGETYIRKRKVLARVLDRHGRYRVSLRKNGKNQKFFIHRLVGEHFLENKDNKKRIKHINGMKTDNIYRNLKWE